MSLSPAITSPLRHPHPTPPLTPTLLHCLLFPLTYLPLPLYPPLLSILSSSSSFPLTRADKNTTTPSPPPLQPPHPPPSEKNRLDAHACQSACGKPGRGFHWALRAVIGRQRREKTRPILVHVSCFRKLHFKGQQVFYALKWRVRNLHLHLSVWEYPVCLCTCVLLLQYILVFLKPVKERVSDILKDNISRHF